jgi:hypothetical protein
VQSAQVSAKVRAITRAASGAVNASLLPPAGPQAQGWTGKCKSSHCQCLADAGVYPLAIGQNRPSRLGPAGEGRSDSRVLQLVHPVFTAGQVYAWEVVRDAVDNV